MSETQETASKKRDKSKRMECRKRHKSTPIKKPDVVPIDKRELKRKTREEKRKANKNKDRESTPPEKKPRNKDETKDKIMQPEESSANNQKEMIESEDNITSDKEKLQSSSAASNKNDRATTDPAPQKSEENLEDSIHKDLPQVEANSSNIQILEISVIEMAQPEMEQLGDISISDIEHQIGTQSEEIQLSQNDDGVYELEIEETRANEVSSSEAMLILEQEIPNNSVDSIPDEAAAHDESLPKEAEEKNGESETEAPCKGVNLPDQWFLDSGFPTERVDQWKTIFRTSEPVPFDTASTSRVSE